MSGCIFCSIVRGELDAYVVYRGHGIMVFLDKFPISKGHLLVIPEKHYESAHDSPARVSATVFAAAAALARIYRRNLGAPGVRIVTNSGRHAGQEVFHFHVHVIPYWSDGKRGRHVLSEDEAREVLEMLEPYKGAIGEYLDEAGLSASD